MAKRRSNHEGTVFKRDNGKWRAQLSLEGRRLSYTADNKEDVKKWLRDITNQVDVGLSSSGFDVSLFTFFNQWLRIVESSKSQTTFNTYTWIIEKRAKRYLKDRKVAELTGEILQQIYRLMALEGISNHSILQMHKVMSVCFSHGVKTGYLARNPCKAATPPRPKR